jgi:hypothetical protein
VLDTDRAHVEIQAKLSQRLCLGFVFTLIPAFGVISFFIGMSAYRKIASSPYPLVGMKMSIWCIIVGFFEALFSAYAIGLLLFT